MATSLIDPASLSRTVDTVNALAFERRKPALAERTRTARWIAARQGLAGAYADTFGGFPDELERGIVLFTGERITSASARHILGEEACRVLRWLGVRETTVQAALARADTGLMSCLARAARDPRHNPGEYCCGKCTVGLWRNLLAGGLDRQEERLRKGVGGVLRSRRASGGKWKAFPFWYTVLALSEMGFPEARQELAYAAPVLERAVKRASGGSSVHGKRRHELAGRALGLV